MEPAPSAAHVVFKPVDIPNLCPKYNNRNKLSAISGPAIYHAKGCCKNDISEKFKNEHKYTQKKSRLDYRDGKA